MAFWQWFMQLGFMDIKCVCSRSGASDLWLSHLLCVAWEFLTFITHQDSRNTYTFALPAINHDIFFTLFQKFYSHENFFLFFWWFLFINFCHFIFSYTLNPPQKNDNESSVGFWLNIHFWSDLDWSLESDPFQIWISENTEQYYLSLFVVGFFSRAIWGKSGRMDCPERSLICFVFANSLTLQLVIMEILFLRDSSIHVTSHRWIMLM